MKKIALFSLMLSVFSFSALGGEVLCGVECNSDNNGKYLVCPGFVPNYGKCESKGIWSSVQPYFCGDVTSAPTGFNNIGTWDSAGFVVWVKKGTPKTGDGYLFAEDKKENVCLACRQGFEYDEVSGKCVNVDEPVINPECKPDDPNCGKNPRTPQLASPCDGTKKQNDACSAGGHATKGRCRLLSATPGGVEQMTCAATECEDGYLLWLNAKGNSQGICHSEKHAKKVCSNGCNNCKPNEKCVPWIVDTPSNLKINGQTLVPKKNGAYKECHCEPDAGVVTGSDISCKYVFSVYCDDGKTDISGVVKGYWSDYPEEIELTKEKLSSPEYEEYNFSEKEIATCFGGKVLEQDNPIFKKLFNKDLANLRNFLDSEPNAVKAMAEACKKDGGFNINVQITGGSASGSGGIVYSSAEQADHSAEIAKAKQTIDAFFANAKDNRSVWKNAEGKFNTARLASDITAGVVLGTVGGVVSGIIIKKNQVKKGFEALHCAVGGQTVADWGDEFSVGLR